MRKMNLYKIAMGFSVLLLQAGGEANLQNKLKVQN